MAGYEASFKVVEKGKARSFAADRERLRREAATVGPGQQRVFSIQISSHEFCAGAVSWSSTTCSSGSTRRR